MSDTIRKRLLAVLSEVAPDLGAELWGGRDVRELPRGTRDAICNVLGFECANRGLDDEENPNRYGVELEALIAALTLDE